MSAKMLVWDEASLVRLVESARRKVEVTEGALAKAQRDLDRRQAMLDRLRAGEQVVSRLP